MAFIPFFLASFLLSYLPSLFSSRGYWSIIREERKRARREGGKEPERQKRVAL